MNKLLDRFRRGGPPLRISLFTFFFNWLIWVCLMAASIERHKGKEHLLNMMVSPHLFLWIAGLWYGRRSWEKTAQEKEEGKND